MSILTRLYSSFSLLPSLLPNKRKEFIIATLIYIIEPKTGLQLFQPILKMKTDETNDDERVALTHNVDKKTALAIRRSCVGTLCFEDVPELLIEIAFIASSGKVSCIY